MKELTMLVWLTQLGISVAGPPVCFVLLSVWLRGRFELGAWVIWAGAVLGVIFALDGLRNSLKAMERLSRDDRKKQKPETVSFNEHE